MTETIKVLPASALDLLLSGVHPLEVADAFFVTDSVDPKTPEKLAPAGPRRVETTPRHIKKAIAIAEDIHAHGVADEHSAAL